MAVYLAYSLALQAMVAGVGLGMSAAAAPDQATFVLCSYASHPASPAPGAPQTPQCPFCFVAAQSAGHAATAGEAPACPAYRGLPVAAISDSGSEGIFVPHFRHRQGEPRAPPAFSV